MVVNRSSQFYKQSPYGSLVCKIVVVLRPTSCGDNGEILAKYPCFGKAVRIYDVFLSAEA
jgi:hypothetical protein